MKTNNLTPKSVIKYVEEIIGEHFHAKQVESIGNAAVGVIKAVDLKIQSKQACDQTDRPLLE